MGTRLLIYMHGTAKSVPVVQYVEAPVQPSRHWVSVDVTAVVSTRGVCEDTVLGAVGLVVVGRAVPLVPQEQVYSTAGTTAVHICVVVIILGRVVEVGVAVVYDSIVGSVLVDGLEEQLVVVLHKIVC